jgi:hypothetical protein
MDFDTLAREASLGMGLAVRPPAPNAAAVRPPPSDKPAEVLAALMDFSGGVALAELLQAPVRGGPANPDASRLGYDLQERVQAQLDAVSTHALQRLQRDRRAESGIALTELRELMASAGLGADPGTKPAVALRLASELRKRVGWRLGASMRQAQSDLARLRANIAGELRTLGPRAAQLERIDAALETSLQHKLADLYDRVLRAAEQSFDRACLEACASLPEGFGDADLARWLAPSGWIARDRDRCERTVGAFCVHLRRGLEGLVMAAIQAEVGS